MATKKTAAPKKTTKPSKAKTAKTVKSSKKKVASSLSDQLLNNRFIDTVLDRRTPASTISDLSEKFLEEMWDYDITNRRPAPALIRDGILSPTDLDLASFMSALANRNAIINLPEYKSMHVGRVKAGVQTIKTNRHGKILGMSSNKDTFKFSVRIEDANVVDHVLGKVGRPTNFLLTAQDGSLYPGWKEIQFTPNMKENAFFTENKLWTGSKIYFKNFVHPNRWISFFGAPYYITKLLILRIEETVKFLNAEIKRISQMFPYTASVADRTNTIEDNRPEEKSKEAEVSISVPALEVEVDAPFRGLYDVPNCTAESLQKMIVARKKLQYNMLPRLRFAARLTELAFMLHVRSVCEKRGVHFSTLMNQSPADEAITESIIKGIMPAWLENMPVSCGYRAPGKRTNWIRYVYVQDAPGNVGHSIKLRFYNCNDKIAASAANAFKFNF